MEHFACVQIQRYFSEKEKYKINKLLSNNGVERAGGGRGGTWKYELEDA